MLVLVVGCQPWDAKYHTHKNVALGQDGKPLHGRVYSVYKPKSGDRWEWNWRGSIPASSATSGTVSEGTESCWITGGEHWSAGMGPRGVKFHVETRIVPEREMGSGGTVIYSDMRSCQVEDWPRCDWAIEDFSNANVRGLLRRVPFGGIRDEIWSGMPLYCQEDRGNGLQLNSTTTFGDEEQVTTPGGTFTCLSYVSTASVTRTKAIDKGFFCPAIGQVVKRDWTLESPAGKSVMHYELTKTTVNPQDDSPAKKKN